MAVTNSEFSQESPVCDFSRRSLRNPENLYLNAVGIPSLTKRTITKNIDLYNYDGNNDEDKDKWEVYSDGEVGTFFDAISDKEKFDDYRENTVSTRGEGHVEV